MHTAKGVYSENSFDINFGPYQAFGQDSYGNASDQPIQDSIRVIKISSIMYIPDQPDPDDEKHIGFGVDIPQGRRAGSSQIQLKQPVI